MPNYLVFNQSLGVNTARPIVDQFECSLDELAGMTALYSSPLVVALAPNGFYLRDNSTDDTLTFDYTYNESTFAVNEVSAAYFTLAQRQAAYRALRDTLIEGAYKRVTGQYRYSETRAGLWFTYLRDLLLMSDSPANPEAAVFPTVPATAEDASDSPWSRGYRRDTVIGSVGQSGGIPTGQIFETATNANGLYYRTTDGFQVCRARIVPGFFNSTRMATNWTFPAAFHSLSSLSFGATFSTHDNSNNVAGLADTVIRQCEVMSRDRSTTSIAIHVLSPTYSFVAGDTVWLDIWAIGRWLL